MSWVNRVTVIFVGIVLVAIVAMPGTAAEAKQDSLLFTFIGNEAFSITDGEMTLVSDFPYKSGAFNYMKYDMDDVETIGEVVSLITHRHDDHFHVTPYRDRAYTLIAPENITALVPGYNTIPIDDHVSYQGIDIVAQRTHHTPNHRSYLVTWHGVKMYFVGDTERPAHLLAIEDVDVAFVTPWLLATVAEEGATIDARKIVIYHHRRDEKVTPYQNAIVPRQGDTFSIPFKTTAQ